MVIIFYDSDKERLCICTEQDKMQTISIDDPDILSCIPNDDILYVKNAHFITKQQFGEWLEGNDVFEDDYSEEAYGLSDTEKTHDSQQFANKKFIHPVHNGAIYIADLKSDLYPDGVELLGKYDFAAVDDLGGFDALERSALWRSLLAKGKIEVVDYNYVKKHYNKKGSTSAADAALDKIIIKNDARGTAELVATGQIGSGTDPSDPIEIYIE